MSKSKKKPVTKRKPQTDQPDTYAILTRARRLQAKLHGARLCLDCSGLKPTPGHVDHFAAALAILDDCEGGMQWVCDTIKMLESWL